MREALVILLVVFVLAAADIDDAVAWKAPLPNLFVESFSMPKDFDIALDQLLGVFVLAPKDQRSFMPSERQTND